MALPQILHNMQFFSVSASRIICRSRSIRYHSIQSYPTPQHHRHRVHLLFGANTDVGKSIISTGLVRAAANVSSISSSVNYIKPLQCGGSDESFVLSQQHTNTNNANDINCKTLFRWETPVSPHLVSRWENQPVSDNEVLSSLQSTLRHIENEDNNDCTNFSSNDMKSSITIIETAGGVLSPSSSSPLNESSTENHWGWSTQADLYSSLHIPVIFVGDGRLGGISVTITSLESLWSRGYQVDAVVFIESASNEENDRTNDNGSGGSGDDIQFGKGNAEALREYIRMQMQLQNPKVSIGNLDDDKSIICLPSLPPMPQPLDDWYESNQDEFQKLHHLLSKRLTR